MTWFKSGTIAIVNGSDAVTGTGTGWSAQQILPGFALATAAGVILGEIETVNSPTSITLVDPITAATASGIGYFIVPTRGSDIQLFTAISQLISDYASVRDNAGQGMFGDGAVGTPAVRFAADQDTGMWRPGNNLIAWSVNGTEVMRASATGLVIGPATAAYRLHVEGSALIKDKLHFQRGTGALNLPVISYWNGTGNPLSGTKGDIVAIGNTGGDGVVFANGDVERARIDSGGNFLIGGTSSSGWGDAHRISKAGSIGSSILGVDNGSAITALFYAVASGLGSAAAAAMRIGGNADTGRSINAAGTINASGADYAEYMTKADGVGTIEPGDVCGVNRDGRLVTSWVEAHSFVIKSTAPAYVGGDTWAASVGPRPQAPAEDATEAEQAQYESDLAAWEAALEAERQKVDRIAFSGQVPVNVGPATLATIEQALSDGVNVYLVAQQAGASIAAAAVIEADMSLPLYMRRLGKVWAIREDRPWVDVQHG